MNSYVSPTPKFHYLSFFCPVPKLCGLMRPIQPLPKFDTRHPRTDVPTLPTLPTLFSRLVKLM